MLCRLTINKKIFFFSFAQSWQPHDKIHNNVNFFVQLNILDNLIKKWYNGVGWEMVDCMCKLQVLKKNQNVMLEGVPKCK